MADQNTSLPYPMMFDPSQWSNQFSNFQKKKLTPYMGLMADNAPTDALGNPIQSYADTKAKHDAWQAPAATPGTTLNNTGGQTIAQMVDAAAYNKGPAPDFSKASNYTGNPQMDQMAGWQALIDPQGAARGNTYGDLNLSGGQPAAAAAPTSAAPANPYDMSQAYLTALSNPGKVTTPGATVPQAPTPTGQSGVMDQFLANWKAKGSPTTGAGNYNNAGFFAGLQGTV